MRAEAAHTIRVAGDRGTVEEWALVLAAAGIPHSVEVTPAGWSLLVRADDTQEASAALLAYDGERGAEDRALPADYGQSVAGIVLAGLLIGFHGVTIRAPGVGWAQAGAASAARIMEGEVWRTVTALTLHADPAHILGNAAACAIFVTALARALGPGLAAWLVLLAGAGGNFLTALLHRTDHSAVGASTAIFGALGSLVGLALVRRQRPGPARRRAWMPLASGLALLALLGTGERADLAAHLFGFVVGGVLGIATGGAVHRPPRRSIQMALALGALAVVVGCWLVALA